MYSTPPDLRLFGPHAPAPPMRGAVRGFGASDGTVAVQQVAEALGAAENELKAARASLVRLGVQQRDAGLGPLSQDLVDSFHAQRRHLAGRIEAFIERLIDESAALDSFVASLPGGSWFGTSRAQRARDELGTGARWAAELNRRIPPLPYELVSSPRESFNPHLYDEGSFAGPPAAAGVALAVAAAIVVASWGVERMVASFNASAQSALANAQQTRAIADSEVRRIEAMRRAGLTPQQIAEELKANPPPKAPDAPAGLADVLKWSALGLGGLAALFVVGQIIAGFRTARVAA